jgi:hypothetical protein
VNRRQQKGQAERRSSLRLLNAFPEALAAEVPADHARLLSTFTFVPTTFEDEARRRFGSSGTQAASLSGSRWSPRPSPTGQIFPSDPR